MTPAPTRPTFGTRLRNAFRRHYLLTLWLPFLVTLLGLLATMLPYPWHLRGLSNTFGYVFLAGLAYLLVSAIARFCKKRIAAGLVTLLCLVAAILAIVPAYLFAMFAGMASPTDGFADDLTLPAGIELAEPLPDPRDDYDLTNSPDPFQKAILTALTTPPPSGALTLALPSLESLQTNHPDVLARYLAAHPGWRVYSEKGSRHATRRWRTSDAWVPELHNYYSSFGSSRGPKFQSRTNIGLDGKPWARFPQIIQPGTPTPVTLDTGNGMDESHVAVPVAGLLVEQFEQSLSSSRPVTTAAFAHLESEFAALAANPTWPHAKTLLPPDATTTGTPAIQLYGSGGTYKAHIRCNPGEPGSIHLKAFEITRDYQLSPADVRTRTNERTGWSGDPAERFLAASDFMIKEGDWGQCYAARFELWFEPDSDSPERKILEQNFKIEGWQH